MANITREEELKIKEWQKRTGGGCIDRHETLEEALERSNREVESNRRMIRNMQIDNLINTSRVIYQTKNNKINIWEMK